MFLEHRYYTSDCDCTENTKRNLLDHGVHALVLSHKTVTGWLGFYQKLGIWIGTYTFATCTEVL